MTNNKQLLEGLLKALAADKSKITVTEALFGRTVIYSIKTSPRDYGRVLGKKRATLEAFNVLLKLAAYRDTQVAKVELAAIPEGEHLAPAPFVFNSKWGKAQLTDLAKTICGAIFLEPGRVECTELNDALIVEIKMHEREHLDYLDEDEDVAMFDEATVRKAIKTVLDAIGKASGRNISVVTLSRYIVPNTTRK